jgi:hypothetical protein
MDYKKKYFKYKNKYFQLRGGDISVENILITNTNQYNSIDNVKDNNNIIANRIFNTINLENTLYNTYFKTNYVYIYNSIVYTIHIQILITQRDIGQVSFDTEFKVTYDSEYLTGITVFHVNYNENENEIKGKIKDVTSSTINFDYIMTIPEESFLHNKILFTMNIIVDMLNRYLSNPYNFINVELKSIENKYISLSKILKNERERIFLELQNARHSNEIQEYNKQLEEIDKQIKSYII